MTRDEAEVWCRKYRVEILPYQYRDELEFVYNDKGKFDRILGSDGKSGVTVTGWFYPDNPQKDKIRIRGIGPSLEEAVMKARDQFIRDVAKTR